ncbi:MAG: pyridoxal phosphate-dependent aminotransferase family protein, partial [Gammaproteobacteria bacterium]|nr:pyridoxal phosphate-dependent aminotransferase family protein [Gammaproteobacteria bacterium]
MPLDRLTAVLDGHVRELERKGTAKGAEAVVTAVEMPRGERGPRIMLEGEGERPFIRLNSNSYLGMGLRPD